jgi:hypothetical protein
MIEVNNTTDETGNSGTTVAPSISTLYAPFGTTNLIVVEDELLDIC